MGLFFHKKPKADPNTIYSPFVGKVMPIEQLKDKTFADKVMGDGIAVVPSEGKVYSPIDGKISALLDTKHAYGITSDAGFELLIHVGQDTVNLKGEHFVANVKEGDKVKKGDLLGSFDIAAITAKGYNIATPVILITGGEYKINVKANPGDVNVGDMLFTVSK